MKSLDKKLEEFREKLIDSAVKVRIVRAKLANSESDTLTADEKEAIVDVAIGVVELLLAKPLKGTEELLEAKLEMRISQVAELEKDNG